MVPLLTRIVGRPVRLEQRLGRDVGPVWADATQLEQVIMNLCMNARDAMPGGGRLMIETAVRQVPPGAEDPCKLHGSCVTITVRDTGSGMDAQTVQRIFEPFFTTKEKGKGTGLGLSAVSGIVKQSGGFITVTSEPSKGSTFTVHFPLLPT